MQSLYKQLIDCGGIFNTEREKKGKKYKIFLMKNVFAVAKQALDYYWWRLIDCYQSIYFQTTKEKNKSFAFVYRARKLKVVCMMVLH